MPIRPENKALYPPDWKEIVARIRKRSGGFCELCGAENYKPHPITGSKVVLTVAHLNHDPRDCSDYNLKDACQKCHNSYDAPMRAAGRKQRRRDMMEENQGDLL
jgi:hypothetical protein